MNETSNQLAVRVLHRIKAEDVHLRPRWEFLLKHYTFWTMGVVAVILGAIAFSAALFEVENTTWRLYMATHPNLLSFVFAVAPFLWVIALAIFMLIGYATIRHTNRGYRYPLVLIAVGAVLTSVTLGTALYAAGYGGRVEEALGSIPPFYRPILQQEHGWWLNPNRGLLGGVVMSVASAASSSPLGFVLKDFSGHVWKIDGADLRGIDLTILARGGTVRVVGVPVVGSTSSSTVFHACFVFPWRVFGLGSKPPSPPVAVFSSSTERMSGIARSDECRGIRPYKQLRDLDENGF